MNLSARGRAWYGPCSPYLGVCWAVPIHHTRKARAASSSIIEEGIVGKSCDSQASVDAVHRTFIPVVRIRRLCTQLCSITSIHNASMMAKCAIVNMILFHLMSFSQTPIRRCGPRSPEIPLPIPPRQPRHLFRHSHSRPLTLPPQCHMLQKCPIGRP